MSVASKPADALARSPLYKSLFVQVVAALILGVVLGMATPGFAIGLKFFSDAFLKLISMIVAPIVFWEWCTGSRARAISRRSAGSGARR